MSGSFKESWAVLLASAQHLDWPPLSSGSLSSPHVYNYLSEVAV